MGNADSYLAMAQEPGRRGRSIRAVGAMVLGVLAVLLLYLRFGPVAAYLALMAALLVAAVLGPSKLRRLFGLLYCLLLIGLLIALAFQPLASSDLVPSLAERNAALGWLVRTFGTSFRASLQLGLIVAAFCILGFVVASVWISSDLILILSQTSGMGRWAALKCLFLMALGVWGPWAMVENGKVTKVRPEGLLQTPLGPGIVVIHPGNAVVFEWGGKVTRIAGPGVVRCQKYEIMKKVVDLRPQWLSLKAEDVLTQDRIPLAFKMTVGYQVQPKADADRIGAPQLTTEASEGEIAGDYPVYKESVYRLVFRLDPATPDQAVKATADSLLRDVVGGFNLDALYHYWVADKVRNRGDAILPLESQLKARLAPQLSEWGLRLLGADITTVEMPHSVREKVLDWWAMARRRSASEEAPETDQSARQVFVSHAEEDAELAHRLAADLERHGWKTWIAPESIRAGEVWPEAINRGLEESLVFVLLLTEVAVNKETVRLEAHCAIQQELLGCLHFIPLVFERCDDAPALWNVYQHVTFLDSYEDGLKGLLRRLEDIRGAVR